MDQIRLKLSSISLILIVLLFGCQKNTTEDSFVTKNSKATDSLIIGLIHTVDSKVLNEQREIVISLPKGYEASDSSYPVLYLTDGFQNIEHVRGSVELLTRTGHIPPIIIVGIKSVDRVRDFTYTQSNKDQRGGGGKRFLTFIESELIPYIDHSYRTNGFKILEGHSLGGLFTATTLLEKPELFQSFIVMSPSLWWNGEELTQKVKNYLTNYPGLGKKVFFGIGKDESSQDVGMRKELTNFIDVLKTSNIKTIDFDHMEFENEGHMSSTLLSNYYGLRHVFSDLTYSKEFVANFSNEAFLKNEKELSQKYGKSAKRSAETYYSLGAAIYENNLSGAITVFKRSVQVYPKDLNLITTLARLYERNNEASNAIDIYKYAIKVSKKNNYGNEEIYQKEIERLKKTNFKHINPDTKN